MAIGRYHQFGQTDPTSNFFKLDYQMLAQPIIKADQEYKETQAAYDAYLQRASSQEVLPQDVPGLLGRITNLQDKEKQLRASVDGDILNPLYQEGIRGLFTSEMKDPWYRKAAFAYNRYNQDEEYLKQYTLKTGDMPQDWQAPFISYWKDYKGMDNTPDLPPSSVIEPIIPYTAQATDWAKNAVQKKVQQPKGWSIVNKTDSDGNNRQFLVDATGARITKAQIKEMISLTPEWGKESKGYNQLQKIYDSSPQLQKQWKTFDDYFNNSVLEGIAQNLSYEWEDRSVSPLQNLSAETASNPRTGRLGAQVAKENTKIRMGPYIQDIKQGVNPVGYPNYKTATTAKNFYMQAADDIEKGFRKTDPLTGQTTYVKGLEEKLYDVFGVPKDNNKGVAFKVYDVEGTTEKGLEIAYKDKSGTQRTVTWHQLLSKRDELPEELKAGLDDKFLQVSKQLADLTALRTQAKEIEDFERVVGVSTYGPEKWNKIKKEGFISVLSDKQKNQVANNPTVRQASLLQDVFLNRKPLTKEDLREATGIQVLADGRSMKSNRPYSALVSELKTLSDALGIPEEEWADPNSETAVSNFVINFNNRRRFSPESLSIDDKFTRRISDPIAVDVATSGGKDRATSSFMKKWEERWKTGLDENLTPVITGEGVKHGVKQAKAVIYAPNADNSTGSGSSKVFWESMQGLLDSAVSQEIEGDWDQKGTNSAIMLYDANSNLPLKDDQYKALRPKDGKSQVKMVGLSLSDEGWVLVLQPKNNPGAGFYELRNQDTIVDYMEEAGMGSQLLFDLVGRMSKQFNDLDGDEDLVQPTFDAGTQEPGQARSRSSVSVNTAVNYGGSLYRPVSRLERDTRDAEGKLHKAGTYSYYSLSEEKTIYAPNLLDVGIEIVKDRNYVFNKQGYEMTTFTPQDFEGRISIPENITNNTIAAPLKDAIKNDILGDPNSPQKLKLNSATRDASDPLSIANPYSAHITGNAVDFDINTNSQEELDFWYSKWNQGKKSDYEIILEVPDTGSSLYRELSKKYPGMVRSFDWTTGVHVHIEMKK